MINFDLNKVPQIIKSQRRIGAKLMMVTQNIVDIEHHDFICDFAIKLAEKERVKRKVNFLPKQCYRRVFRKHMSNDDMRLAITYLYKNKKRIFMNEKRILMDEAHLITKHIKKNKNLVTNDEIMMAIGISARKETPCIFRQKHISNTNNPS